EPTAVEKADIVVSRETNPGLTAAEIARTLRARGRQGVVSISGMGPVPMNRALKAIVLARRSASIALESESDWRTAVFL
ncbi:unnamed protein product, partial [Polarella glacialis]